jgi:hypothetical protein
MFEDFKDLQFTSWFELNEFLQNLQNKSPVNDRKESFKSFLQRLEHSGIAFITFEYGIDGVSTEIAKYITLVHKIIPEVDIHLIGGEFDERFDMAIKEKCQHFTVPGMAGFAKWKLFDLFFHTKLQRGEKQYNDLLKRFWEDTIYLTLQIGTYIAQHGIQLLYVVNTNSNPGNVSLALALVLISSSLGIPVISNNHDFYWEAGKSEIDIKYQGTKHGPRDHYFTNSHLPEIFSVIEMLYPWKAKNWLALNINYRQSDLLVRKFNYEPDATGVIGTAIDTQKFKPLDDEERKRDILCQVKQLIAGRKSDLRSVSIEKVLKNKELQKTPYPFVTSLEDNMIFNFCANNLLILQPTRIIERKRIELDFLLISALLENSRFNSWLRNNKIKNILLMITGPILKGHEEYFTFLLKEFQRMLLAVDSKFHSRIFLSFLFSELDKPVYIRKEEKPLKIQDLFQIASLVTLPSETEGRGLPIIEACACETPILTSRYYPENVYAWLVGEHLPQKFRLRPIEFEDRLDTSVIDEVVEHLAKYRKWQLRHNSLVIKKRYCFPLLQNDLEAALEKLYLQLKR